MEKQVKNVFLPSDMAVLATVFEAGVACCFLGEGWSVLGAIIILSGAMMVPFYHHGYRLDGRKGVFVMKEILLPKENKDEILAFIEGRQDMLDLHPFQPGGALVEVYSRKGDDSMMARYFEYSDFMKGKEYPLHEITARQCAVLESFASDSKHNGKI